MSAQEAACESRHITDSLSASPPKNALRLTVGERKWLLMAVDITLVNGALLAAVVVWNRFRPTPALLFANVKWFVTLTVLWIIVSTVLDLYNLARSASTSTILLHAGVAAVLATLLYLAIPWLTPPLLRRLYAVGLVGLTTSSLLIWRGLYASTLAQPAFRRRALILGSSEAALRFVETVKQANNASEANPFRGTGYEVIGLVSADPDEAVETESEKGSGLAVLGTLSQLVQLHRRYGVDEIIAAVDETDGLSMELHEVLLDCRELGLQVSSLSSVYERLLARLPVDYAQCDLDLVLDRNHDSPAFRLSAALKRLMDVCLAVLGLTLMVQIIPLLAVCNKIWSPGPLFFRQQRVGRGGRSFRLFKFRSMVPDAEAKSGAVWSGKGDSRITPVGGLLRRSRLDELPQLINVLRGEMSIVGPRPERPFFVGQIGRVLPLYRARHAVKPGLTGWAQVHYEYGDSIEDSRIKLEYDLYYVKYASLHLDLLTVLHTVRVVLGLKGR